ncbi:MAG: MFS transporter [Anaerolineae bacterium SM23_ 63]|nr:MAG: MFS transporter [Anaerolineae bacterium SM23_ 63]HEY47347.1 MFS transporter [Anaerolineae bacterium]
MSSKSRYRWLVVSLFFAFILLHQADKLLISPLTTPIMETFGINEAQMGAVFTGALLVSAILYPVWGYLYDRFARPKLLALASAIWGATTWLSAIAPTYPTFLISRASTGIDDSSYPGLYSLIADYFGPSMRGKVYGLLQLGMPLGYMIGLFAATMLSGLVGWRGVFYITGSLGLLLALLIYTKVREAPRGKAEPELEDLDKIGVYRFDKNIAVGLFRKRSLLLLFAQGFFGVFPWNVITYWFFRYLETERNYTENAVLMTMVPAVLVLAVGYFVGGSIGDFFFKRTPRGRLLVSTVAVLLGAILLFVTMNIPVENQALFLIMLLATALFIPFASPNVISSVYDITLPEVRSTALAVQYFIENAGAALAPFLAGLIAVRSSLHNAILIICISAWIVDSILFAVAAYLVPEDIKTLRQQLRERAEQERAAQMGTSPP